MTLTLDESSLVEEQEAALLFKEARQRRRRRWVSGISVVLVAILLGLVLTYSLAFVPRPTSHPLPSSSQHQSELRAGLGQRSCMPTAATVLARFESLTRIQERAALCRSPPRMGEAATYPW